MPMNRMIEDGVDGRRRLADTRR